MRHNSLMAFVHFVIRSSDSAGRTALIRTANRFVFFRVSVCLSVCHKSEFYLNG